MKNCAEGKRNEMRQLKEKWNSTCVMVQWMKKHDEYKTSKIKHFHIIKLLKIDTNFSIDYDNTVLIFNQTGRMGYLIGP